MIVKETPTLPDEALAEFRCKLIEEEADEFRKAVLIDFNLVDAIDALGDIIYVVLGAANSLGVNLESHFDAIHQANMKKVGGGMRADGKILKPEGWIGPDEDHRRILANHESDLIAL